MLLLPLLLLWLRAPMAFSLPWRWSLLGLLGWGMLQGPSPIAANGQDRTPWLVRPTAAPQADGAASLPLAQPAAPEKAPRNNAPPPAPSPADRFNPAARPASTNGSVEAGGDATPVEQAPAGDTNGTNGAAAPGRQREGTLLRSTAGRFIETARRWTFVSDAGGKTYLVLENLALDRVVTAIRQDAGDDRWSVDATITEFAGENYVLLSRVLRATAAPADEPPGQLDGSSSTTNHGQ